jgi:hypothetical protein
MLSCSSFSVLIAWMLSGTDCRFSVRFCAVTTTSSSPPAPASALGAAVWA